MARSKSINQDDLRSHNLSVVLSTLLQANIPLSRAQLAKETGLTKATLSLLSDILLKNNVVVELPPVRESANGRPSTPLDIKPKYWVGLGMQINTDGYGCMAVDLGGNVVAEQWEDCTLEGSDPEAIFVLLDQMVRSLEGKLHRRHCHIAGSCLALPGLVTTGQRLLMAPNLGWKNIDITQFAVVQRLQASVSNEANLAAIAQIAGYATRNQPGERLLDSKDSFLYISTDIGVGGAFVRDGNVVKGDHGFGGELGHVSVDMNGPLCRCGRYGCLEMYAGRRELLKAADIDMNEYAGSRESVQRLLQLWEQSDDKAVAAIERAMAAIASVAASSINLLDVDTIVLGGFWSLFNDQIAQRMLTLIVPQVLAEEALNLRVVMCAQMQHPALQGAAVYGLRRLIDHPADYLQI